MKGKKSKKKDNSGTWIYLLPPGLILGGGIFLILHMTYSSDALSQKEDKEAIQWSMQHWENPVPFQGEAPESYHPLAKGIHPENCASCHPQQWKDWSKSLHAEGMGPGVIGQYADFDPQEIASCNRCHAPLSEQWEYLVNKDNEWAPNTQYDKELLSQGITCAACHLRQHERHGPPLREGKAEGLADALHGAVKRTPFFESSEFCKGCHQHTSGLKPGGKFIENTYNEWLESPAYDEGKQCQHCHMPDRQHHWKGIHDKEMTASAVTLSHEVSTETPTVGERFEAVLKVKNTGAGHMFPTYNTPAVFLRAAFLNEEGKAVPNFYESKIIQRRLSHNLSEQFDTRLAPMDSMTLSFKRTVPKEAHSFKLWVWVEPDHFYEGFFRARLRSKTLKARELLEEALQTTNDRQYSLFSLTLPVQ